MIVFYANVIFIALYNLYQSLRINTSSQLILKSYFINSVKIQILATGKQETEKIEYINIHKARLIIQGTRNLIREGNLKCMLKKLYFIHVTSLCLHVLTNIPTRMEYCQVTE